MTIDNELDLWAPNRELVPSLGTGKEAGRILSVSPTSVYGLIASRRPQVVLKVVGAAAADGRISKRVGRPIVGRPLFGARRSETARRQDRPPATIRCRGERRSRQRRRWRTPRRR